MQDIVLLLSLIPVLFIGYFIMKKVDIFIYENELRIAEETKMKEPSAVKLPGDLSLIEIDKEIENFRSIHMEFDIILKAKDETENE